MIRLPSLVLLILPMVAGGATTSSVSSPRATTDISVNCADQLQGRHHELLRELNAVASSYQDHAMNRPQQPNTTDMSDEQRKVAIEHWRRALSDWERRQRQLARQIEEVQRRIGESEAKLIDCEAEIHQQVTEQNAKQRRNVEQQSRRPQSPKLQ